MRGFRVDLDRPILQYIDARNLTAKNVEPITTFRWLFVSSGSCVCVGRVPMYRTHRCIPAAVFPLLWPCFAMSHG